MPEPTAPRSLAQHYFDVRHSYTLFGLCMSDTFQESIDSRSEYGDDVHSLMSAVSSIDLNTPLCDVSPDAL